ncbi:MAG TPA: acyl-CoA dehydrogenase, partial [Alcaligenes faecalis]|nr:acyl-CoA dehydrogenase [Alcaligenes faecalis]
MNQPLSPSILNAPEDRYSTHQVLNQALPASGFNAFTGDQVLRDAINREAPWAASRCQALGAVAGDETVQELARLANRHIPELKTHDRFGNRIDWLEFHPSWHELMGLAWQ